MISLEPININLVIVGDGSVGKTCTLIRLYIKYIHLVIQLINFLMNMFPQSLRITQLQFRLMVLRLILIYGNNNHNTIYRDTAGQESYANLRTLSYG